MAIRAQGLGAGGVWQCLVSDDLTPRLRALRLLRAMGWISRLVKAEKYPQRGPDFPLLGKHKREEGDLLLRRCNLNALAN
jgi:hypothetical protein